MSHEAFVTHQKYASSSSHWSDSVDMQGRQRQQDLQQLATARNRYSVLREARWNMPGGVVRPLPIGEQLGRRGAKAAQ